MLTPRLRSRLLAALLLSCGSGCTPSDPDTGQITQGSASSARAYGYHIGDRIRVHYHLKVHPELLNLEAVAEGPVNEWLMLRQVLTDRLSADPRQEGANFDVEYQVFKGVQATEELVIPPLPIRLKSSDGGTLEAPAFHFSLVPVIPSDQSNEEIEPQPGGAPPLREDEGLQRQLRFWTGLLFAAGGLSGLRHLLERRRRRPFRRSQAGIRRTLQPGQQRDALCEGLRGLHRALDETQGQTLFLADLEDFLAHHPPFEPLREELEFFFRMSTRLFFSAPASTLEDAERIRLIALLSRCIKAEVDDL